MPDRERPKMCRRVVLPSAAVVPIALRVPRCDRLLEPIENVLPQARLVIVHKHRRGDVHRRDQHHSLLDRRGGTALLDFVRDVDDLLTLLGVEGEILRVCLHVSSPPPPPSAYWWLVPTAQRMFDPKPLFRPSRIGEEGNPL